MFECDVSITRNEKRNLKISTGHWSVKSGSRINSNDKNENILFFYSVSSPRSIKSFKMKFGIFRLKYYDNILFLSHKSQPMYCVKICTTRFGTTLCVPIIIIIFILFLQSRFFFFYHISDVHYIIL